MPLKKGSFLGRHHNNIENTGTAIPMAKTVHQPDHYGQNLIALLVNVNMWRKMSLFCKPDISTNCNRISLQKSQKWTSKIYFEACLACLLRPSGIRILPTTISRSFVRKLLVDVGNTDTSHILKNFSNMCNIVHPSRCFHHNNNALLNISHSIYTFKYVGPHVSCWPSCMHTIFLNHDSGSYHKQWHILLSLQYK